jgi:hypothetical protein
MAVEIQTFKGPEPGVEAGVIDDARKRQRQRRLRVTYGAFAGLVLAGGLVGSLLGGSHRTGHRAVEPPLAREHVLAVRRSAPRISPGLEGGAYGWAVEAGDGGGSCCTIPTASPGGIEIGAIASWSPAKHEDTITALVSSGVARFAEVGTRVQTTTLETLPYGLRLARIRVIATSDVHGGLRAFSARGTELGYLPQGGSRSNARWWQSPSAPPAGPCQLGASGVPGLTPQWGQIAASIKPYPRKIIGRAFFSCASTEYYLHHWPLETAILLDAQHPGTAPAAIPVMHGVRGAPGVYEARGAFDGDLTARRQGNAWLVVAGGSGPGQRLEVLHHLKTTIALGAV